MKKAEEIDAGFDELNKRIDSLSADMEQGMAKMGLMLEAIRISVNCLTEYSEGLIDDGERARKTMIRVIDLLREGFVSEQ